MNVAVRLTSVEFSTHSPGPDADRMTGLGFLRTEGTEEAVVLRTCADPYGCRVVLRPGPRPTVARLLWRPADGDVPDGLVGDGYRLEHGGGTISEVRWEQDRQWSAGPALSCPLHPGGSTELCVVDPPLIDAVLGPDLGRGQGIRLVPQGDPTFAAGRVGLRLRTDRVARTREERTPGGLLLRLDPAVGRWVDPLESESVV